jgi:serine/threonine-protein kinase
MPVPESKLAVGHVLDGRYVLERVLGEGGMGMVFAARHVEQRELVAIKVLHENAWAVPAPVERFLREARLASQIDSDHVVRVLDVVHGGGTTPTFIVMEYLEGKDLGQVLESRGRIRAALAIDFVLQACEALADAHRIGIVHRDLKPSNLFVTTRSDGGPLVKVLDFGISKAMDQGDELVTATKDRFGTPAYASPEQTRSAKNVDARSDIWALGVILFELISGKRPFRGKSGGQLIAAIAADPPVRLRLYAPDAPDGLEELIEACLVKDREHRIGSVADLASRLAPFASDAGRASAEAIQAIALRPEGHRPERSSIPAPQPKAKSSPAPSSPYRPRSRARASHTMVVGAIAGLLAAGAFIAFCAASDRPRNETTKAAAPSATPSDSSFRPE